MVKTFDDYIDRMVELFPEISRKEILSIMKEGMKEMSSLCMEGLDYAVDYKIPGGSFMIASNTKHSGRALKTKRRDCFLESRRKRKAIMDEMGVSARAAGIEKKRREKCLEEITLLETQNET